MSDMFTEFFDLAPLGRPGWEHSRVWLRGADTPKPVPALPFLLSLFEKVR